MHKKTLIYGLAIGLASMAVGSFAVRALTPSAPTLLTQVTKPSGFQFQEGAWFWIEAVGTRGARLIRMHAGKSGPIAVGDGINGYSVSGGKIAWAGREGSKWTIHVAASDGSGAQTLWTGDHEPHGLCLANNRVFWLDETSAVIANSAPLPPLGGGINIVAIPVAGGTQTIVATLMEPAGQQILGIHDGQIYLSAFRPGPPALTILYRAPISGGVPYRIAGETSSRQALLTQDGTLYWTAESPEASSGDRITCIRRLTGSGKVETLGDWMPSHGKLYETNHGVCYVDPTYQAAAWPLSTARELPKAFPLPENFSALAAGGGDILLQSTASSSPTFPIYREALP